MEIYRCNHRIDGLHVNMHLKLKTSSLFRMLQEAAADHFVAIGYGPEYTLHRNLLWVIARQKAEIARLPDYEEKVVLETWPGSVMHTLFPRYYQILDQQGQIIVKASSVWALIDAESRKLVGYDRHGIDVTGLRTGSEISLPRTPKPIDFSASHVFRVPYSYLDLNAHMNNTRYFDLVEDLIPEPARGDALKSVAIDYCSEARLHDELTIRIGQNGAEYYVTGDTDKTVFKMALSYAPSEEKQERE